MTTTVRFEAGAESSDSPPRELICNVWPVTKGISGAELGEPIVLRQLVSVDDPASTSSSIVDLPHAGDYLIEVEMPSGQSTRRFISVPENNVYRFVVNDRRYSLKSANLPVSALLTSPVDVAPLHRGTLDVDSLIVGAPSPHSQDGPDLEVRILDTEHTISLDALREHLEQGKLSGTEGRMLKQGPERGQFVTISLPSQEGPAVPGDTARSWLRVSGSGAFPTLIAYPRSWQPRGLKEPFRLVARRAETTGPEAAKWRVGLELLDPAYGALIEYLTRRDTQSSEVVSKSVYGMAYADLSENPGNPVAAAAGAYLFVLGDVSDSRGRDWLIRLQAFHPGVPDLSIALGWWKLRESERGNGGWKEAKVLFRMALQQGLPYYTLGLHILVDALNLLALADPKDDDIKPWLAIVTALDTACVRKEPFTTLQVSRFFPSAASTSLSGA